MRKWVFVAGVAVGYVLGAKAGRERYEQMAAMARRVRDHPTVRNVTTMVQEQAEQAAGACKERLKSTGIGDRFFGQHDEFDEAGDLKPRYWETVGVSAPAHGGADDNEPRDR